jgi:endonuclease III
VGKLVPHRSSDLRSRARSLGLIHAAEEALRTRYGSPTLGNKRSVISELVFIILSARTTNQGYAQTYRALRKRFRTWEAVRDARPSSVAKILKPIGLSRIKTRQIQGALKRISDDFGSLSDASLRSLDTQSLERYLIGLPGVGLKTARCVMMYAADRDVFPADTHCITLFYKLGLLHQRPRLEDAQDLLQDAVPPTIRKSLHVNAVAHGQQTCVANRPRCADCAIRALCRHPGD